ncbi:zinc finger CCHC domain-containing protein 7-like isoform X1 [Carya illinoinensis]|uniref:CCHC-type domain-containing protein n=1 Tax=Carya illinoinensis TaxID=32201 RepID=A0A8T1NNW1_CARIL|nr:zinc finger CCHC domain-containing protein 7-like isoform X1 [Carya illinoinensis]KAG6631658.1 hypothetical protein CIPAW_13G105300 [Carya illinoinensis]
MGRMERQKAKLDLEEDGKTDDARNSSYSLVVLSSSDDDEEANEDLSLKIVEKALLTRAAKLVAEDTIPDGTQGYNGGGGSSGVVALSSSSALEEEVFEVPSGSDGTVGSVNVHLGKRKVVKRERRKKIKKTATADKTVIVAKDEEKEEVVNASDPVEFVEPNVVEITDNIVFRKLLRGPRYFDPPDSSWGTCFKCGEEGHSTANCTTVKRRKPCFVCGSLEHASRQCSKGQDCFICKNAGHRAKDCPEKHKGGSPSSKVCLKCGDSGHDMFSCRNDPSADDLKGIQCYICKRFGHLCCVSSANTNPRLISCYRCGQWGHTGLACAKACGEASGTGSPGSCFKCGEGGHFARECMSNVKAYKRSWNISAPTLRVHREEKGYSELKSIPFDLGKVRKRKKTRDEGKGVTTPQKSKRKGGWILEDPGDLTTPQKSKRRGGWIAEDPGDYSNRKSKKSSRSPATPSTKGNKISSLNADGHASSSQSSNKAIKVHSGSLMSEGPSKANRPRFSASRFGNFGSDGLQRNHGW